MKKETKKSPIKIKAEEFELYLNNLLTSIDENMEKRDKTKSIRDLCMEKGYNALTKIILGEISKPKNAVQNFLSENNLKLVHKKEDFYLVDEEQNLETKLSKAIEKKLNLLGIYSTQEQEDIADIAIKNILNVLMRRPFMHSKHNLTNGEFSFQNIVTLQDLKKNSSSKQMVMLEGIEVKVENDGIEASLPYIFTRIVSLNEKDAFSNESKINDSLRALFTNRTKQKSKTTTIQEQLKENGMQIKAKEQDGVLIFYAVMESDKQEQEIILIDPKLTHNIISHLSNEIRSSAKKYEINNQPENNDNARSEYLCRCGEFFSILYNNGYIPDFVQTPYSQSKELKNEQDQLYIEDKGTLRLVLPYGINGDITSLNQVFIECFGKGKGLPFNKTEFTSIMAIIMANGKFDRTEYLKQKKGQEMFYKSFDIIAQSISQEITSDPTVLTSDKGLKIMSEAANKIQRVLRRAINSRQAIIDRKTEEAWRKRAEKHLKYKVTDTGPTDEKLALPQFPLKELSDYFGGDLKKPEISDVLDQSGNVIATFKTPEL